MGSKDILLIGLLTAVILPIVFSLFMFLKARGEKKISSQEVIRTHPPKTLSGFFLGFAFIMLLGGIAAMIYCCITDSENTTASKIITLSICIAGFSAIGFFGYAHIRFNYVIADTEGILVCRLFRKKRYYKYEEIGYFQNTLNLDITGGLIGYDKNYSKIFAIEAVHIGVSNIAQRLRDHGIKEKSK